MIKFWLKPAGLSTALLAGLVLLIRTAPYVTTPLDGMLAQSGGCSSPCFLNIQPGITGADEAYGYLTEHPWVGEVWYLIFMDSSSETGLLQLEWEWSGQQPGWIDANKPGALQVRGQYVDWVRFTSRIAFGDVWLSLGRPEGGLISSEFGRVNMAYFALYKGGRMAVGGDRVCQMGVSQFWERGAVFEFRAINAETPGGMDDLTRWLRSARCQGKGGL